MRVFVEEDFLRRRVQWPVSGKARNERNPAGSAGVVESAHHVVPGQASDCIGTRQHVDANTLGVREIRIAHVSDVANCLIESFELFGIFAKLFRILVGIDDEMLRLRFVPRGLRRRGNGKAHRQSDEHPDQRTHVPPFSAWRGYHDRRAAQAI